MDVAIGHAIDPRQIVDAIYPLQEHGNPLNPIGQLGSDRLQVDSSGLLEVGELGDLQAVQPDLPAKTPGAEGRRLPVVLDETDIVFERVDTQAPKAVQVDF